MDFSNALGMEYVDVLPDLIKALQSTPELRRYTVEKSQEKNSKQKFMLDVLFIYNETESPRRYWFFERLLHAVKHTADQWFELNASAKPIALAQPVAQPVVVAPVVVAPVAVESAPQDDLSRESVYHDAVDEQSGGADFSKEHKIHQLFLKSLAWLEIQPGDEHEKNATAMFQVVKIFFTPFKPECSAMKANLFGSIDAHLSDKGQSLIGALITRIFEYINDGTDAEKLRNDLWEYLDTNDTLNKSTMLQFLKTKSTQTSIYKLILPLVGELFSYAMRKNAPNLYGATTRAAASIKSAASTVRNRTWNAASTVSSRLRGLFTRSGGRITRKIPWSSRKAGDKVSCIQARRRRRSTAGNRNQHRFL
jgi:hypothetical protein